MNDPVWLCVKYLDEAGLNDWKWIPGFRTTEHAASSYGQPVLVDADGKLWDAWQVLEVLAREEADDVG